MTHNLRTTAGSHERFLVIEVFGRYAGFTALLPTMAGAANRCLIPECPFDIEKVTELMVKDRMTNPSRYSVVLVSEGARFQSGEMVFSDKEKDPYGHQKLGGISDAVAAKLKECSPKFNNNRTIQTMSQRLGYLIRCGEPDALDSIVPMAFGNIALDLIIKGRFGRLVSVRRGQYDDVPLGIITSYKKVVDMSKYYETERYRPKYTSFDSKPLLIMTSDV
jgi:ATP-dependent phosphofructokinase / diphosphate-dependent phosphofructokinase